MKYKEPELEYRENNYFDETSYFLFETSTLTRFKSKVEYKWGAWHTVDNLSYKAITLPCVKL